MTTKKQKQQVKALLKGGITIGELKELFASFNYPDDIPIGRIGHYGEFHLMRRSDFMSGMPSLPTGFNKIVDAETGALIENKGKEKFVSWGQYLDDYFKIDYTNL